MSALDVANFCWIIVKQNQYLSVSPSESISDVTLEEKSGGISKWYFFSWWASQCHSKVATHLFFYMSCDAASKLYKVLTNDFLFFVFLYIKFWAMSCYVVWQRSSLFSVNAALQRPGFEGQPFDSMPWAQGIMLNFFHDMFPWFWYHHVSSISYRSELQILSTPRRASFQKLPSLTSLSESEPKISQDFFLCWLSQTSATLNLMLKPLLSDLQSPREVGAKACNPALASRWKIALKRLKTKNLWPHPTIAIPVRGQTMPKFGLSQVGTKCKHHCSLWTNLWEEDSRCRASEFADRSLGKFCNSVFCFCI